MIAVTLHTLSDERWSQQNGGASREPDSNPTICGNTGLRVDYYFPGEHTIVEIAFSLRNPVSEFERDILKAVVAQESGCSVNRLIFLCKPGGEKRHQATASLAFIQWLLTPNTDVSWNRLAVPNIFGCRPW